MDVNNSTRRKENPALLDKMSRKMHFRSFYPAVNVDRLGALLLLSQAGQIRMMRNLVSACQSTSLRVKLKKDQQRAAGQMWMRDVGGYSCSDAATGGGRS